MATGDNAVIRRSGCVLTYYADAAVASSVASRDLFLPPPGYRLVSIKLSFATASASGTVAFRKITDASAPNASAGSTVIELLAATTASTAGTANTVVAPALTTTASALKFKPGDRLAVNFGGTATSLVGLCIQLEFVPANTYGNN